MKNKISSVILAVLIVFVTLISLTGCKNVKQNNIEENFSEQKEVKVANTNVSNLKYYVPEDYQIHNELRGLLYTENTRKVYAKGDVSNNNDAIYIDTYIEQTQQDLISFVENANKNLNEKDVKITFFKDIILNKGTASVFARENYVLKKNGVETLNYAYFTYNNGNIYTVNIHGPNAKSDEIKNLAKEVVGSLKF